MTKLAFMTSVCPDWDLDRIFDAMERYGYDALEPRIGWPNQAGFQPEMPAEQRKEIRARFEKAGKSICCIATGCKFAVPDTDERNQHVDDTLAAIDLAADLGAPFVRTFGGAHGGGEMNANVNRAAETYRRVLDRAKEKNIVLLLETHDSWCSSSLVRAVVERVNSPNLRVLWDIMHPQRMFERPEETMQILGGLTRHLHAHDGNFPDPEGPITNTPLGEGAIDHATPMSLLKKSGYDGFVSVEVIHKPGSDHDPEPVLRQYAEVLKKYVSA